jgi:hypothetical protein
MSFIKHTWVTGETITATLLNRIENAIKELYDNNMELATDTDCDELISEFNLDEED